MEQNTSQEIRESFLPSTKDHSPYIDLIIKTVNGIHNHKSGPDHIDEPIADHIIYLSFLLSQSDEWKNKFIKLRADATRFYTTRRNYWKTIAMGLSTPEVKKKTLELLPNLDWKEYFKNTTTAPPRTEHISTILPRTYRSPDEYWGQFKRITPGIAAKEQKEIAPARKESIIEFITRRAPSINYLQVFILISRHTKNRFSRRGRKVYPYGQEYASRNIKISLRSVRRIFSWLRRQGIIIKRSNENPELKKSASWFVCTSWKQSFYFRDPKGLRPKRGSRRTLGKRHFKPQKT